MERALKDGIYYGLSHMWMCNKNTLVKLSQWVKEKNLSTTPQENSIFISKKNEISQMLQEILSAHKVYHTEFLNSVHTPSQENFAIQNQKAPIPLDHRNTRILNGLFGFVQTAPSEVIPEHYVQEPKYFLIHSYSPTGYVFSAEDALLGLSQDQITAFIIYIKCF